jgi:hypothetical protein
MVRYAGSRQLALPWTPFRAPSGRPITPHRPEVPKDKIGWALWGCLLAVGASGCWSACRKPRRIRGRQRCGLNCFERRGRRHSADRGNPEHHANWSN